VPYGKMEARYHIEFKCKIPIFKIRIFVRFGSSRAFILYRTESKLSLKLQETFILIGVPNKVLKAVTTKTH
jgi:hypothetical protein